MGDIWVHTDLHSHHLHITHLVFLHMDFPQLESPLLAHTTDYILHFLSSHLLYFTLIVFYTSGILHTVHFTQFAHGGVSHSDL